MIQTSNKMPAAYALTNLSKYGDWSSTKTWSTSSP